MSSRRMSLLPRATLHSDSEHMSMLHALFHAHAHVHATSHVHTACLCCMSMSMLHVYVPAAWTEACSTDRDMQQEHGHGHVHGHGQDMDIDYNGVAWTGDNYNQKVLHVRYHSGGSMKLNACILVLVHIVYL
jgi:hypothetical protein